MTQKTSPLTVKHRIGYALGNFGGCMTFSLMSAFMTRYYVNVALMDTASKTPATMNFMLSSMGCTTLIISPGVYSYSRKGRSGVSKKERIWNLRI